MVSTWMGDHSSVKVDPVAKNTIKSLEWRNGASNINSWGKKNKNKWSDKHVTSASGNDFSRYQLIIDATVIF